MNQLTQLHSIYVPVVWIDFFRFFFGWRDEEIAQWAKPYEADLLNEDSLIHHDSLLKHVVGLLIPNAILADEAWSGADKVLLCSRLGRAIAGEGTTQDPNANFDWESASDRVNLVLSEYGVSLADVNKRFRRFDSLGRFVPVEVEE